MNKEKTGKLLFFTITVLIAWLPMLIAAWDATKPVGSEAIRDGDNDIRSNNAAIEATLGANHEFSTGGTNSGKHTTIVMQEQASITTAANEMGLYCADLGAAPGLYLRPQSDGTAIQLTDVAAKIVNAAMAADSIDSAQYVDGSIDLAHLSVNSIDSDQYVDNSIDPAHLVDDFTFDTFPLSPSAAPDANYELANKKYVDDQIAAYIASEVTLSAYTDEDFDGNAMLIDHAYKAATDGWVSAVNLLSDSGEAIYLYVGLTSDPKGSSNNIIQAEESTAADNEISVDCFVAKDEYFEITSDDSNVTIKWKSMGTLSKPVDYN